MCEVGFLGFYVYFFFPSHTLTPATELSSFFVHATMSTGLTCCWHRTVWFIQGLFLSKPQSVSSVLTLVLMMRKGLTYIHHLNCCENLRNLLTNTRTRFLLCQPLPPSPKPKYALWSGMYFLSCVRQYREVEQQARRIVSEARNASACARSLLARRGLTPSLVRV